MGRAWGMQEQYWKTKVLTGMTENHRIFLVRVSSFLRIVDLIRYFTLNKLNDRPNPM